MVDEKHQAKCIGEWMHRETTRARICGLVKKILRKCGYLPDLQDSAVQRVLQQA